MSEHIEARLARLEREIEAVRRLVGPDDGDPGRDRGVFPEAIPYLSRLGDLMSDVRDMMASVVRDDDVIVLTGRASSGAASAQAVTLSALKKDDRGAMALTAQALSGEHRLEILALLAGEDQTASSLAQATGLSGGPLYHHLRELLARGMVSQPRRNAYRITDRGVDAFLTIGAYCRRWRDHHG